MLFFLLILKNTNAIISVMKNKLLFCFAVCALMPLFSAAQIVNQRDNVVTTQITYESANDELYDNLFNGNYETAKEIYYYLKELGDANEKEFFTREEVFYFYMFFNEWEKVSELMNSGFPEERFCGNDWYIQAHDIRIIAYREVENLRNNCRKAGLDQQTTDVLELFFLALEKGNFSESYYEHLDALLEKYDVLEYNDFVNDFLPLNLTDIGYTFGAGSSYAVPLGLHAEYFNPRPFISIYSGVSFDRLYCAVNFEIGNYPLQKSFDVYDPFTRTFEQGYRFTYTNVRPALGYMIVRNDHLHIAPYLSVGWIQMESTVYLNDVENKEYQMVNFFNSSAGINFDIKLVKLPSLGNYEKNRLTPFSISLKIDTGLSLIGRYNSDFNGDGAIFYCNGILVLQVGKY